MKKIILLAITIATVSAQKLDAQSTFPNSDAAINYLNGGWTWHRSCGGFSGGCFGPAALGYNKTIVFSKINNVSDSIAYSTFKNGTLVYSGGTKILFDAVSSSSAPWYLRRIVDESPYAYSLAIFANTSDTTWLHERQCADCFTRVFYRGITTVGISENHITSSQVNLFPVPAKDHIAIQLENNMSVEKVAFFNLNGQEMSVVSANSTDYNISGLAPGVYFVRVNSGSNQYWSKFVKE